MLYRDFEAAEYHHRRAMELNPSDAYIKARSAAFYTFKGEPDPGTGTDRSSGSPRPVPASLVHRRTGSSSVRATTF